MIGRHVKVACRLTLLLGCVDFSAKYAPLYDECEREEDPVARQLCLNRVARQEQAERQAYAEAMSEVGSSMQATGQNLSRPSVQCTTTTIGATSFTNCR